MLPWLNNQGFLLFKASLALVKEQNMAANVLCDLDHVQ
jgi:hypothetical protein